MQKIKNSTLKIYNKFSLRYLSIAIFSLVLFFVLQFYLSSLSPQNRALAAPGIYGTINFQGKIVNKTGGTNLITGSPACIKAGASDDTCDFRLQVYDGPDPGTATLLWQETYNQYELGTRDGIFSFELGWCNGTSVDWTGCEAGTGVDFNTDNLYVVARFNDDDNDTFDGSDDYFVKRMNSVPYAQNSGMWEGIDLDAIDPQIRAKAVDSDIELSASGIGDLKLNFNTNTGQIQFYNTNNFLTSAGALTLAGTVTANGTGNNYFAGNVGIGTSSPGAKLEVVGAIAATGVNGFISSPYQIVAPRGVVGKGTGTLTSVGTAATGSLPYRTAVDLTGQFLYVVNYSSNTVQAYTINQSTGALTSVGTVATGTNPINVAVDPTNRFAYVTNQSSNTVQAYTINQSTGALTSVGTVATGTNPVGITVDPTGRFVYVANTSSTTVQAYTINQSTGALTSVGTAATGASPNGVTVDPNGRFAYVTNQSSNTAQAYTINQSTGALTSVGTVATGTNPVGITVDPTGRFVYVVNSGSTTVQAYTINSFSGGDGYFAGKLGIGTNAPVELLDVRKDQNAGTSIRVRNDTSGTGAASSIMTSVNNYSSYGAMSAFSSSYTTSGLIASSSLGIYSVGLSSGLRLFTFDSTDLTLGTNNTANITIKSGGNVGIGQSSPTAVLHLKAGTASANTAPLKFTAGTNLTTAEAGAMEWDGTNLYMTQTTGPTRKTIAYIDSAMTGTFDGVNLSTGTQGGVSYYSATNQLSSSGAGTAGQALVSGGTGSPTWFAPTAGSIIFAGTSGILAQDNSNFFFDNTNKRLGIGTATPGYKLSVAGTDNNYLSYIYNSGTGAIAGGLSIRTDGTGNLLNLNYGGSDLVTINSAQATFNLPTSFNASGDVSLAYDLNFTNQSASYIKTLAPFTIEVGENFESNNLSLRTFNSGSLVFDSPGGVALSQAQAWSLATSTSALNISSGLLNLDTTNGRIGIGDVTPDHTLDVAGNIGLSSGGYINFGDTDGTSGYGFFDNSGTLQYKNSGGAWTNFGSASSVPWNGILSPTANQSLTMGAWTSDWTWNSLTTGTGLTASSSSLSSGSLFSLASTSTAATGNTQKILNISTSGANATSTQTTYGLYATNTHTGTASTNVGAYFSASGGTNNYAAIFDSGNVGIGTTSPTAKLTIQASSSAASLGSELLITTEDRDFSGAGNWSGTGWTIGSGVATHTAGANAFIHTYTPTAGKNYQILATVNTTTAGTLTVQIGAGGEALVGRSVGTLTQHSWVITAINTTSLRFVPNGTWEGTIDDVSVKEITIINPVASILDNNGYSYIEIRGDSPSNTSENIGIGKLSMSSNISGFRNTALGGQALEYNTTGSGNTGIGWKALRLNTTGANNTAVGLYSMLYNTTGTDNTSIGLFALNANTVGSSNTALGRTTLNNNNSGSHNVAIGRSAMFTNVSGSNNVAVGNYAGNGLTDPENSVYIGYQAAGYDNNDSNSIVIGYQATGIGANTVVLGNNSITTTALKGSVGIGTTAPDTKLHLSSTNGSSIFRFELNKTDIQPSDIYGALEFEGQDSSSNSSGIRGKIDLIGDPNNSGLAGQTTMRFFTTTGAQSTLYERMRLDSNGNVGIGISAPNYKLSLGGTLALQNNSGNLIRSLNSGDSGYTDLSIQALSTNFSAGNVGIGIAAPTSILHTVASGAKTASYIGNLLTNTATSSTASVTKTGLSIESTGTWNGSSAINRGLYVNATGGTTNYSAIFEGGRVGIGTTTPNALLQISGSSPYLMINATSLSGVTGEGARISTGLRVDDGTTATSGDAQFQIFSTSTLTSGIGAASISYLSANPSSSSSASYRSLVGKVISASGNANNLTSASALMGLFYETVHQGSGTVTGQQGLLSASGTSGASGGDITTNRSLWGRIYNLGTNSANQTTAQGLYLDVSGTGSTITDYYGVYLDTLPSGITNKYGIYVNDTVAKNYLGGNLGIGITSPSYGLHTYASGAKTANFTGAYIDNVATGSTNGLQKNALYINSTGTWTGASSDNYGLQVNVSGGSVNWGVYSVASNSGTGTAVGLYASASGAISNYAAIFDQGNVGIRNSAPAAMLEIGTAGSSLGTLRLTGNTSGYVQLQTAAAAGSWTMTLPTGVGSNGQQLTTDGAGVTSWTAAGSTRDIKNIIGLADANTALSRLLETNIYKFNYKPGMGTGDSITEYVGVMADESAWAMHYNGSIVNPVNTLGYAVLGIQALNTKINTVSNNVANIDPTVNEVNNITNEVTQVIDISNMNGLVTLTGNTNFDLATNSVDFSINTNSLFVSKLGNVGINTDSPDKRFEILDSTDAQIRLTQLDSVNYADLKVDNLGNLSIFTSGANIYFGNSNIKTNGNVVAGGNLQLINGKIIDKNANVIISFTPEGKIDFFADFSGDARRPRTISLNPEYSGTIKTSFYGVDRDTEVDGDLVTDIDTTEGSQFKTYYEWKSNQTELQYQSLAVRIALPNDFDDWQEEDAITIDLKTKTLNIEENQLMVYMFNPEKSTEYSVSEIKDLVSDNLNNWFIVNIKKSDLVKEIEDEENISWKMAGETGMIYLRMAATKDGSVQLGEIKLNYLSKW